MDGFAHLSAAGNALENWGRFGSEVSEASAPAHVGLIRGELDRTQLDLISIDADHHVVTRTPEHVQRAITPLHVIAVNLSGHSVLTPTDGRPSVELHPSDISYWTSEFPYRWEFDGPVTMLMLRVPFAAMDIAPGVLRPLIGHRFPSTSGLAHLVVPFAENVLRDVSLLGSHSGPRIGKDLVSLFTTMLVGELETRSEDHSDPAFFRVTDYIAGHLSASLDLHTLAGANQMSPRYLQSLFQSRGTSVSEWIRLRRVESARHALADPALADVPVSQIAAQFGFADHAHFARSFRAAFDETPSQWRTRALSGGTKSSTEATV